MKTNDLHIELPSSKSISNRWLVLNHIAGYPFVLRNLSTADDTQLLQALLSQLRRGTSTEKLHELRRGGTAEAGHSIHLGNGGAHHDGDHVLRCFRMGISL